MNGQQRELIRTSFEQVRQHKEEASELFYEHLFAGNPELLPMFKSASARSQVNKLMQVLEYAVDHLDHWPTFMSQAEELGARHVAYGVRPDHW
jgi:hemoglobin-like flavoprotein